jgi:very-short-patch-repair endonuclease
LLFRSAPEVTFAPLPVFVRGGKQYKRIEPDFVIIKDGIVMIVEVDGVAFHNESPQEAHDRLTMLVHEGVHVERVNAKECETPESAKRCAEKILGIITKLKTNK